MTTPAHNRLGLDYHAANFPFTPAGGGIIDAHNHTREPLHTRIMVEAAKHFGITEFYTMCQLEAAPAIHENFPNQFRFIAVPAWQSAEPTEKFFHDWRRRIEEFAKPPFNSRLVKFHAAPGTCRRWGITLEDPRVLDLQKFAYSLGYHFMTHVGDPKAWFYGEGKYAKPEDHYGTFDGQFAQLERMLEKYPDRLHLGAHFGGSLEDLDRLAKRLDRYPHYVIDTSATKWVVRAIAEQSAHAVKEFLIHYQDRILFGSDLVVGDKYEWDHYASRYWAHRSLWETDYRGQSNIEDPDAGKGFDPKTGTLDKNKADGIPRLTGLKLPSQVLQKLYRDNALRHLPR